MGCGRRNLFWIVCQTNAALARWCHHCPCRSVQMAPGEKKSLSATKKSLSRYTRLSGGHTLEMYFIHKFFKAEMCSREAALRAEATLC